MILYIGVAFIASRKAERGKQWQTYSKFGVTSKRRSDTSRWENQLPLMQEHAAYTIFRIEVISSNIVILWLTYHAWNRISGLGCLPYFGEKFYSVYSLFFFAIFLIDLAQRSGHEKITICGRSWSITRLTIFTLGAWWSLLQCAGILCPAVPPDDNLFLLFQLRVMSVGRTWMLLKL